MAQLGFSSPRGGEGFDYGGYRFTVLEMDQRACRVTAAVSRRRILRWKILAERSWSQASVSAHGHAKPPRSKGESACPGKKHE
jgi:hypothetical protein